MFSVMCISFAISHQCLLIARPKEGHHENDSEYQQHDDGYESDREEEEDGAESEERLRTASTSPAPAPPFEWDGPPVLFSGFLKKKGDKVGEIACSCSFRVLCIVIKSY